MELSHRSALLSGRKFQGRVLFRLSAMPFLSEVKVEAERGRSRVKMWLLWQVHGSACQGS